MAPICVRKCENPGYTFLKEIVIKRDENFHTDPDNSA